MGQIQTNIWLKFAEMCNVQIMVAGLTSVYVCVWPGSLQQQREREVASPRESSESKGSLYTSRPAYTQQESPYLPRDLDQSLGIAREEVNTHIHKFLLYIKCIICCAVPNSDFSFPQIVTKEKEVLEWQRKYEESHQEVVEMR